MATGPEPTIRYQVIGAGMFSGVMGTTIGHPFDLIKTRLQTQGDRYRGPVHALRSIVHHEGITALYKGLGPPMASMVIVNATSFAAYDMFKRLLLDNAPWLVSSSSGEASAGLFVVAGALTSLAATPITTPSELVKIRAQLDTGPRGQAVSSLRVASSILSDYGLRALYTGYTINAVREVVFLASYFGAYEVAKRNLQAAFIEAAGDDVAGVATTAGHTGSQHPLLLRIAIPMAGGTAGALAWTLSFPLDVVKSEVQASPLSKRLTYADTWQIARSRFASQGLGGFYRGASTSIIRAFLVSSTRFSAYELGLSILMRLTTGGDADDA